MTILTCALDAEKNLVLVWYFIWPFRCPQFRFWVTDVLRFRDHIDCLRHVLDSFGSSKINSINRSGRVFCLRYVWGIVGGLRLDWVPFCFPSQQQQVSYGIALFSIAIPSLPFCDTCYFYFSCRQSFLFSDPIFRPGYENRYGRLPLQFWRIFFLRFGFLFHISFIFYFFESKLIFLVYNYFWLANIFLDIIIFYFTSLIYNRYSFFSTLPKRFPTAPFNFNNPFQWVEFVVDF